MSSTVLSDRIQSIEESATLALNAHVQQMAKDGKKVYNLTAGELACDTPSYIQDYVKTRLDQNKYTPAPGLSKLRTKIAEHANSFYGLDWIKAGNVVVTAGVKPAIWATLMTLLNPDDEIILPIPAWVSYETLINLTGAKIIPTNLDQNYDLNINDIESKISSKTKAILLNSPQNPTGAIFSKQKLQDLATIINKRSITVISDDIYSKLIYVNNFNAVPKSGFDNVVITGGFSKSQALTGWRIGYLIAEKSIANAAKKLLSHSNGNAPITGQLAAISALDHSDKPIDFDHLKANRKLACEKLKTIKLLDFNEPAGAFYIYIDVRKMNKNSLEWCEDLLNQTGVALVPGEAFSTPGFARMSFVGKSEIIENSIDQISNFCGNNYA